ncbi:WD40 repeat domain-containing serine/threonine protein kinase [Polyangium spumosum]|nr:serine/threonine-protein kinase [Polyangium spumosum]
MPTAGHHLTPTLKLVRPLEAGAMGTVWAAEDLALGARVAVKLMAPADAHNEAAILRFRQEAQAAARIKSPYVASVLDHGVTAQGQPYIVMELLEGETLRRRMKRLGPLPCEDVVRLFGQAARGVGAAHALGVVHRDIKPENLFVIEVEGAPFLKVLDFGIAKQLDMTSRLTSTGAAMGTPPYMSPEQYDDTKSVDHRTDLWAMAVVVYEMLTGQLPFTGASLVAMAYAVAKGEFLPPSVLRAEAPRAVDAWMERAFSLDMEARFGSALEMAEAFAAAMQPAEPRAPRSARLHHPRTRGLSPPPAPAPEGIRGGGELRLQIVEDRARGFLSVSAPGTWARAIAFDERAESLFMAFATGEVSCLDLATKRLRWSCLLPTRLVCLGVGAGVLAVGATDGKIFLFDPVRGRLSSTLVHDTTVVRALAIDAGAGTLAACSDGARISLWRLSTGECLRVVEDHADGVRGIAFDKMNRLWASASRDATVRLWDAGLRPVHVLRDPQSAVGCVAFSPDGSFLAAGRGDRSVLVWAVRGWVLRRTLTGQRGRICSLSFLPDAGMPGALVSGAEDGTMRVWAVESGKVQVTLGAGGAVVECVAASLDGQRIASASADGKVHVYRWPIHPSMLDTVVK